MNTEKVFTAFDKEGNELLLYRKDNDTYIDLNSDNNEVIPKDNIDLVTLIHARKSVNLHKHMLASTIKRKYKKDRERLVETKKYLLGKKARLKEVFTEEVQTGHYYVGYNTIPKYETKYSYKYFWGEYDLYTYRDSLNIKDEDGIITATFNLYENLRNHNIYVSFYDRPYSLFKHPNFNSNLELVFLDGNKTLEDAMQENYVEKKKILEFANYIRLNQDELGKE